MEDNSRPWDFRYHFETSLYWHGLPHYSTTDSCYSVSSSPELTRSFQHPFQLSKEGVIMTYTIHFFTYCSTSGTVSASPDLVIILLDEINLCHNDIQPQQCTFLHRTYPAPPLSVTETPLSLSFYS